MLQLRRPGSSAAEGVGRAPKRHPLLLHRAGPAVSVHRHRAVRRLTPGGKGLRFQLVPHAACLVKHTSLTSPSFTFPVRGEERFQPPRTGAGRASPADHVGAGAPALSQHRYPPPNTGNTTKAKRRMISSS